MPRPGRIGPGVRIAVQQASSMVKLAWAAKDFMRRAQSTTRLDRIETEWRQLRDRHERVLSNMSEMATTTALKAAELDGLTIDQRLRLSTDPDSRIIGTRIRTIGPDSRLIGADIDEIG